MNKKVITWMVSFATLFPAFAQQSKTLTGDHENTKALPEVGTAASQNNLVRLSKIIVDPARLTEYKAYLKEEIEASMRLESGVLTLYAVSAKERPNEITILEIYADQAAYESHLKTPHFQKYKKETLSMVKELELVDCTPLIPGLKIK